MNPYLKNLNRLEFLVTLACTGRCKHCSEGEHSARGENIDGDTAARMVREICTNYEIQSLMTFGGEPLLCPDATFKIHAAAKEMNIPKRQIITNGFFSKDNGKIKAAAAALAESGVNNVLLSADAFHQETIPLETVKMFATAVKNEGVYIRSHPAWLVGKNAENSYNTRTREILAELADMGISSSDGNVVFPSGNALKYLGEYFDLSRKQINPYDENPRDLRSVCVSPNGNILGGNIDSADIMDIFERYNGTEC